MSSMTLAEPIDPTKPPNISSVKSDSIRKMNTDFSIDAILIGSDRKIAIVNGASVQVGDTLSDYTVSDIKEYQVTLSKGSEKKVIDFGVKGIKSNGNGGAL